MNDKLGGCLGMGKVAIHNEVRSHELYLLASSLHRLPDGPGPRLPGIAALIRPSPFGLLRGGR